jgi:hypothetical protein
MTTAFELGCLGAIEKVAVNSGGGSTGAPKVKLGPPSSPQITDILKNDPTTAWSDANFWNRFGKNWSRAGDFLQKNPTTPWSNAYNSNFANTLLHGTTQPKEPSPRMTPSEQAQRGATRTENRAIAAKSIANARKLDEVNIPALRDRAQLNEIQQLEQAIKTEQTKNNFLSRYGLGQDNNPTKVMSKNLFGQNQFTDDIQRLAATRNMPENWRDDPELRRQMALATVQKNITDARKNYLANQITEARDANKQMSPQFKELKDMERSPATGKNIDPKNLAALMALSNTGGLTGLNPAINPATLEGLQPSIQPRPSAPAQEMADKMYNSQLFKALQNPKLRDPKTLRAIAATLAKTPLNPLNPLSQTGRLINQVIPPIAPPEPTPPPPAPSAPQQSGLMSMLSNPYVLGGAGLGALGLGGYGLARYLNRKKKKRPYFE